MKNIVKIMVVGISLFGALTLVGCDSTSDLQDTSTPVEQGISEGDKDFTEAIVNSAMAEFDAQGFSKEQHSIDMEQTESCVIFHITDKETGLNEYDIVVDLETQTASLEDGKDMNLDTNDGLEKCEKGHLMNGYSTCPVCEEQNVDEFNQMYNDAVIEESNK